MNDTEFHPRPTAERPLLGLTILLVEDSRYASDAVRLLCLRSGARIRRADCLFSADRHLNIYRPAVAIIDLGLPDGSGLDLIARMHAMRPRVPIILGTSGDDADVARGESLGAGADGFLPKPVASVAAFQDAILAHMPDAMHPLEPRADDRADVEPDPIAFREDLSHAMDLLALDTPPVPYLRQFLIGIARTAQDIALETEALQLDGSFGAERKADLRAFISARIQGVAVTM